MSRVKETNLESLNEYYNPLLDNNVINEYDYDLCKSNLQTLMNKVELLKYQFLNLKPPKITPSYEIHYEQITGFNPNKILDFLANKEEFENDIKEAYAILGNGLENLNKRELDYFNMYFYYKMSEDKISERIDVGHTLFDHIKKSCIIKLCLGLKMAIKK